MRAIIQRVKESKIEVNNKTRAKINQGLLIFIGIETADNEEDIQWLSGKISRLRIFNDENGVMNLPVTEVKGQIIIVSQFTLHASTKKGNRPSYIRAANPDIAIPIYNKFIECLKNDMKLDVQSGIFGANMQISLINDGPVTIIIDTKNKE